MSAANEGKNPSPVESEFYDFQGRINNQNYRPIGGVRHLFSTQLVYGFHPLFFCKLLEEADRLHAGDGFCLFFFIYGL